MGLHLSIEETGLLRANDFLRHFSRATGQLCSASRVRNRIAAASLWLSFKYITMLMVCRKVAGVRLTRQNPRCSVLLFVESVEKPPLTTYLRILSTSQSRTSDPGIATNTITVWRRRSPIHKRDVVNTNIITKQPMRPAIARYGWKLLGSKVDAPNAFLFHLLKRA